MTRMSNSAARRRRASEVLSDPSPSIRSLARPRRPDCAAAAAIGCRPGVWNANALPLAVSRASLAVSRGPTVRPRQPPAAGPGSGMPARCHWQCHAPAGLGQCGPGSVPARGPGRLRPVCCASAVPLLCLCCASAAPSLRLCCAFIAPLLRLCCAFIAPLLRLCCASAAPLLRLHCAFACGSSHGSSGAAAK